MSTRAMSLVVRLLTTACAGAALGTMSGCPLLFSCPEPWSAVEAVELGTTAEILALTRGSEFDAVVAVGTGGVVVHAPGSGSDATTSNPVNVDLRGVVSFTTTTIVVGDGGTILSSTDQGQTWQPGSSGIVDDLLGIARGALEAGNFLVAISATQILVSSDDGQTWAVVSPPAQGWGTLRAVFATDAELWVVGEAGVAWSTSNPAGAWGREDLGTQIADAVLLGGGRVSGDSDSSYASTIALVSSDALWFRESGSSEWTSAVVTFEGAIVAYGGGFVLTSEGSIYDVDEGGRVERVSAVEFGARAITGNWDGFVVAGDGGRAARAYFQPCVGGRPWVVGGEPMVANLVGEIPHDSDDSAGPLDPLDHQLALAWAQDGLVEHASVAAFARVIGELLSIGAPAELIRATQQAIADELEHARLCFDLASRHAGAVLGPGSLQLLAKPTDFGTVSDSRAGNPVAIALAMLEEGCINETVAAAEAAVAALQCREPRAKSVLERIAADEARHAALAWRTLRWLIDSHAEVAPALQLRFEQLRLGHVGHVGHVGHYLSMASMVSMRSNVSGSTGPELRHQGRLSSHDRAAIQLHVFAGVLAEIIAPLVARLRVVVTSGPALA
jgi:photosystem II stability/assembly factor-like uncharacterized protein